VHVTDVLNIWSTEKSLPMLVKYEVFEIYVADYWQTALID